MSGIPERRKTAEANLRRAVDRLQKTLSRDSTDYPDGFKIDVAITDTETVESMAANLDVAVEDLIKRRNAARGTGRVKEFLTAWFRASYPFAQIFLAVARTGSSVSMPYEFL